MYPLHANSCVKQLLDKSRLSSRPEPTGDLMDFRKSTDKQMAVQSTPDLLGLVTYLRADTRGLS